MRFSHLWFDYAAAAALDSEMQTILGDILFKNMEFLPVRLWLRNPFQARPTHSHSLQPASTAHARRRTSLATKSTSA